MQTKRRVLGLIVLALAWSASATIDHTISHRACTPFSLACNAPTGCGNYTSVFLTGVVGDGPVTTSDTVTIVSADVNGERTGNSPDCAPKEHCQLTTPTTIRATTGKMFRTYKLTQITNKIPWAYYAEVNETASPATSCTTPSPSPGGPSITSVFTYETSPGLNTPGFQTFPGTTFCVDQPTYDTTPYPGTGVPPSVGYIAEYCPGSPPCAFEDVCNTCIVTRQEIVPNERYAAGIGCECTISYHLDAYNNPITTFITQRIFLFSEHNNETRGCNLYSITLDQDDYLIDVSVETDAITVNTTYARSSGTTVCTDAESDGVGVAVTSLGYSPGTMGTEGLIEENSGLILCPAYDSNTFADVSKPVSCEDGVHNLWFYVPAQYMSAYGTTGSFYGSDPTKIAAAIQGAWDLNTQNCADPAAYKNHVPGYANAGPTAALYGKTPDESDCSNQQQSTTVPAYDADEVCYTSVSLATMYNTVIRGEKDQWLLPGVFDGTFQYTVSSDLGFLTQTPTPPPPPTPTPAPARKFTVRVDIADTIMAYLDETADPVHIPAPPAGYNCAVYVDTEATPGQLKIEVCNGGLNTGDTTKLTFEVSAGCSGGANIVGNSTQTTVPLAPGDCANALFALETVMADFVYTNATPPVLVSPQCTGFVSAVGSASAPETVFVFCTGLHGKPPSTPNYIIWGVAAFAIAIVVVGIVVCCLTYSHGKKVNADAKDLLGKYE